MKKLLTFIYLFLLNCLVFGQALELKNGKNFYTTQSFTAKGIVLGSDYLKVYPTSFTVNGRENTDYYIDVLSNNVNQTATTSNNWITKSCYAAKPEGL